MVKGIQASSDEGPSSESSHGTREEDILGKCGITGRGSGGVQGDAQILNDGWPAQPRSDTGNIGGRAGQGWGSAAFG